ncbi:MAG: hypothetical protein KatS3mg062_0427 [Tepidiforma sp.]|nr:MAG: hypothetical protein KatS3mg062_0427 [Tepidiforma sp.]
MVAYPGAPGGARSLRFLNQPRGLAVEADEQGTPRAIAWQGRFRRVAAILERWRVDDEWWREEIARLYYEVELEGGRRLTVFRDLVAGGWFVQSYRAPALTREQRGGGGRSR